MRNVFKNVFSRPIGWFCRFCRNETTWLPKGYGCLPLPAITTQFFPQTSSLHVLCSCLEFFATTNNPCNFWHKIFQQWSTHTFCSWDNIFAGKWNKNFPNILCKCTETPSMLSTNTITEQVWICSWFEATVFQRLLERKWLLNASLSIITRRVLTTDKSCFFDPSYLSKKFDYYEKKFPTAVGIVYC